MTHAPSSASTALRMLAACGYLIPLLHHDWSLWGRPDNEPFYFAVALVLGLSVLLVAFPRGTTTLLRNLDLLVPFGVLNLALMALLQLPLQAAPLQLDNPMGAFDYGPLAVLLLLATLALHIVYAAWQTLAITAAIDRQRVDLLPTLREALACSPRALVVLATTFVVMVLPLLVQLAAGNAAAIAVVAPLLVIWSLALSLLTLAWLPLALDRSRPLLASLAHATKASVAIAPRFALRLVAWAVALGVVTFHSWSQSSFGHQHHGYSWNVSAQWLGGYPHESGWYEEVVEQSTTLGWFAAPLLAVFVCLAIAVKCEVVRSLRELRP